MFAGLCPLKVKISVHFAEDLGQTGQDLGGSEQSGIPQGTRPICVFVYSAL